MGLLRALALWLYRKTAAPMPTAAEAAVLLARLRRAIERPDAAPDATHEFGAELDRRLQEIEASGEPAKRRADEIEAAIAADPARFRRALALEIDPSTVTADQAGAADRLEAVPAPPPASRGA